MLILQYSKTGAARFIPHVDMLRVLDRTLRRAGFKVRRSAGFNPHALIFMSPPCPVNVESRAEYAEIDTEKKYDAAAFKIKFNRVAPEGIEALAVYEREKPLNITAKAYAADYEITNIDLKTRAREIEGETIEKVYAIKAEQNVISATLACGNVNLRADKLLLALKEKYPDIETDGAKILKTKLYIKGETSL